MLNPVFPRKYSTEQVGFTMGQNLKKAILQSNEETDTFPEYRLQRVYGDEIWEKLETAGIRPADFENKKVIDMCSGTGFLSFHILARSKPHSVTLVELSPAEIERSKDLLSKTYPGQKLEFINGDVTVAGAAADYDFVIGNSFLHHLYDIPSALSHFRGLLTEGGYFISLHEPTPSAVGLESGSISSSIGAVIMPKSFINRMRPAYNTDKIDPPGGDVWLFRHGELSQMMREAGFSGTHAYNWHLVRPLAVARNKLHLNKNKKALTDREVKILQKAIRADSRLGRILPPRLFGSCLIIGKK